LDPCLKRASEDIPLSQGRWSSLSGAELAKQIRKRRGSEAKALTRTGDAANVLLVVLRTRYVLPTTRGKGCSATSGHREGQVLFEVPSRRCGRSLTLSAIATRQEFARCAAWRHSVRPIAN